MYHRQASTQVKRLPTGVLEIGVLVISIAAISVTGCLSMTSTPTPIVTPTREQATPTLPPTPTLPSAKAAQFQTYAHGELLPDMRVPIQRNERGEGGWYVVIGTEEGWAQFLSQMGQPEAIWEPVSWDQEILVGALLGIRSGRGHMINITELDVDGVTVQAMIDIVAPHSVSASPSWISYPFHLVRVPREDLVLGPVTFDFVAADAPEEIIVSQTIDLVDLNILWLPGEQAIYPTPTALPSTSTPEPTLTPTPVPNLQAIGTVLEVAPDTLTLRLLPVEGEWMYVNLMKATSILLPDGQPATASQLVPGTRINVLGYEGEGGTMRAAHIDVQRLPTETPGFATYKPRDVTLSTLYDGYTLPLPAEGISSTRPLSQTFSLTQTRTLTENGFVIASASYTNFASLYTDAQYADYPAFVSADSVLHTSQLVYDRALRSIERTHLLPELRMLDREMFELSWSQYEAMQASTTPTEQRIATTALRNAAYFAVPLSLLDPGLELPGVISSVVKAELALITASDVITVSPLFDLSGVPDDEKMRIDYTQFSPLVHYGQDAELAGYYRAVTWHRALALRLSQREETRSAALIAYTLNTHPTPRILWERIQDSLAFFQGQYASLTPTQYGEMIAAIWGEDVDISALTDEEGMDAFVVAIRDLPLPDNPMWELRFQHGLPGRSWRFLSPPFQIEGYVFQETTGENVGDENGHRAVPSLVDLAAVLGSLEAYRVATQEGESEYTSYLDQVGKVRNELSVLRAVHWTEDLHWNWLHTYRALIQEKNLAYPEWMRATPWKRKELQTMFGSWTNVRHDADVGFSPPPTETSEVESTVTAPWGYVEPQPELYARLGAQTRLIIDGLEDRLMLTSVDGRLLLDLEGWLAFLQDVARRELTGQALTLDEYERLGEYGAALQAFHQRALWAETPDATVAVRLPISETAQLVEATGYVDAIYVVVERGRERYLARGGVYSHYEFPWPVDDPLTDAAWREMLATGTLPPRREWVQELLPE
jgi:hypothetical protein